MIKLFGFFPSRSNRPHWALEEIGEPYAFYQLDFTKGDQQSAFYLNLNPSGKVPALQDGGLVLTESGAICNYLGEKFPEKNLVPKSGTHERASYDQWLLFVLTELEQPLWTKGKHTFALPKDKRVPAVIDTAVWEFSQAAALLSQGLGDREFMVGNHFTMVDIFVTHTLRWAVNFKFQLAHPNLSAYQERMEQRPAYQRMREAKTLEIPR